MAALGRWSARHGIVVVLLWVVFLAAATVGHQALGSAYVDNFSIPSSSAAQGLAALQAHEPTAGGQTGQLVFTTGRGTLSDDQAAVEGAVANVRRLPHVLSASDPLSPGTTSADGRTAYSTVHFSTNPIQLGSSYVHEVDQATAGARQAGVQVSYGGLLGQAARPKANDALSELIGIAVAVLVLLVGFGSVYAAGLPILSAILGVVTGLGVLGCVAAATTFASVSPTLGAMMGLGVGIDYGLFLTTHHRQQVMDGLDPVEAAARTTATSGRSVLIAACTVIVALIGLYASGLGFIGKLGLAAAITVAVAALAAVTLVPAMLGLAGRRIDRLRVRTPVAEASADNAGWQRHARRIGAHPWWYLLAGVGVLLVLAIPLLSLRLGHVDAGADPPSYSDKQAYDAIAAGFGPGANGPLVVVVDLPPPLQSDPGQASALASSLENDLRSTPGVASVTPMQPSPDGAILVGTVVPSTSPQSAATRTLVATLQDQVLPPVLRPAGATADITGTLAGNLEFVDIASARLPVIIGVVIAAAFLLLVLTFHSPVLAVKAAILNLLSIGAAYGVIVAVFQWGWGGSLLGISEKIPIESYVPMIMFAIVFGLSMDYEVFLLSRVRERWVRTGDNHASVAGGLAATARVITCAALIITSVFLAFLLSTNVVVKVIALGLGVSIIVDATVIRLVVVPATMFLLGGSNWWSPAWLRGLPDLLEPGEEPPVPVPAAAPEGEPVATPRGAPPGVSGAPQPEG
jgi:RND superfamily putative drug exporter